jgi:erythromycin esterase-like protein
LVIHADAHLQSDGHAEMKKLWRAKKRRNLGQRLAATALTAAAAAGARTATGNNTQTAITSATI